MQRFPRDVSFLIDSITASPLSKYIDENKIAVIGTSLGGYTAMALSGATIDLEKFQEFCKINVDKSRAYCKKALDSLSAVNIEQYQIRESSHFSFLQVCKPNAKAILSEEGAEFVCEDSGIKSRPEIHKETVQQVRKFLTLHGL